MIQIINFLHRWVFFIFRLGLPVILLVFFIFRRHFPSLKILKDIWLGTVILFLGWALALSISNYSLWLHDPVSRNLLPPYMPLTYVLKYSWLHYFATPITTIIFSWAIFQAMQWFNKKFQNVFFYEEEPYLASLGILVTSWPNCLIYLCLVLFLGVVTHFIIFIISLLRRKTGLERMIQGRDLKVKFKKGEVLEVPPLPMNASPVFRLSLLYFWLPCAFLVVLLGGIISKYLIINQLVI